ncbi:hypothetical protein GALMADRAFT_218042 [Galerina marginata CBS 339.88]|uniref:Dihydrofolate reductase n=1 Tax=Galerina marginata (strain CBS 339.88) TaxID=685588 RepID=A0A067U0W6_GALM3|nr:hypothetical protein GALMADRAFT_218042 [Galerina marginata CBS 339.88]
MSRFTIIVAATKSNGIGANARLPWRLPKEMKYFAKVTSNAPEGRQNVVIMGRNTWESIPTKHRPLAKRVNAVISRNKNYDLGTADESVVLKDNLTSALSLLGSSTSLDRGFIIGGATLYTESLALPLSSTKPSVDRILLTRILTPEFNECDVFMPDFQKEDSTDEIKWARSPHAALQEWVGFEVPEGEQEENGVKYEFQMWVRVV